MLLRSERTKWNFDPCREINNLSDFYKKALLSLVFICRENPRCFIVSQSSQIFQTNDNPKSWTSRIVLHERGQIWSIGSFSIFPSSSGFLRWSTMIPDKWKLKFQATSASVGDGFRSFNTNLLNCWAPVPLKGPLADIRYIGKISDGRQKVKSPIIRDFPDT